MSDLDAEHETPEQSFPNLDAVITLTHIDDSRFSSISDTYSKETDTTFFKKSYEYEIKGEIHSLELELSKDKYDSYSAYPKPPFAPGLASQIYKLHVNKGNDDGLVKQIIEKIRDNPEVKNERDELEAIVSFVQTMPFDKDFRRGIKYPYETVYENKGVCSDFSVLLIRSLKELDYDVAAFYFPDANHVGVGIRHPEGYGRFGTDYTFIEPNEKFGLSGLTSGLDYHPELIEFGGTKPWYTPTWVGRKEREDLSSKNVVERKLKEMARSLEDNVHGLRDYTENVVDYVGAFKDAFKEVFLTNKQI